MPIARLVAVFDIAAAEANAHGHAFGKIVDGDGQNEQPHPFQGARLRPFPAHDEMLVRNMLVQKHQHRDADYNPDDDDQGRGKRPAVNLPGRLEAGDNQREKGRGQHHAGSVAHQDILRPGRNRSPQKHRQGAKGRHHPGGERAEKSVPEVAGYPEPPEACLINVYDAQAKMGLHRDEDEEDFSAPVVSVSLGDTARFRIGGLARKDPARAFDLKSGDVLILGGEARLAYHGVDRIKAGTCDLLGRQFPEAARINLTLRRVTLP